jgi:hypothetical protein
MGYPRFQRWVLSHIVDQWDTVGRVARLTGIEQAEADASGVKYTDKSLDLTIVHAMDDVEIPWYEGRRVWQAATGENIPAAPGRLTYSKVEKHNPSEIKVWQNEVSSDVLKTVRWERVGHGGKFRNTLFITRQTDSL